MEAKLINSEENKFKPIDILLTIESKRELEFFWALFNNSNNDLTELANDSREDKIAEFGDYDECDTTVLWKTFDQAMKNLNK